MSLASDLIAIGVPPMQAERLGVAIATVAGVGTAQASAAPITQLVTLGTTAAGQTAFRLPDGELGLSYIFYNSSATAALVFPPSGQSINEGAANASVSTAQGLARRFMRVSATKWISLLGA